MSETQPRTPHQIKCVAVYCGSSLGSDPAFAQHAREMGAEIAKRNLGLVYGGAHAGLMGVIADAALAAGGKVYGVITAELQRAEVSHPGLTSLEVKPTMRERKQRMAELADAFVAMPGGFGTYDEFFEVVTATQLGLAAKPTALLNTNGFYSGVVAQIKAAVDSGLLKAEQGDIVRVGSTPIEVLDLLMAPVPLPVPKWTKP